jgi:hypothetical protein
MYGTTDQERYSSYFPGDPNPPRLLSGQHGTGVASLAVGSFLGVLKGEDFDWVGVKYKE